MKASVVENKEAQHVDYGGKRMMKMAKQSLTILPHVSSEG